MRRSAASLLCAVLLASAAHAIELTVTGLDGVTMTGRAVRLAPEIVIATDTGEKSYAWSDVIDVRPVRPSAAPQPVSTLPVAVAPPGTLRFELADDSIFQARVTDSTSADFVVTLTSGVAGRLTLDAVRMMRSPSATPYALQNLASIAAEADRKEDAAAIGRNDRETVLRGAVRRIEPDGVRFLHQNREVLLKWDILGGVVFAQPAPRGAASVVRTLDGEAFGGRISAGDDSGVTIQSAFFKELALPWTRIERIECRSERMTFLSDLHPTAYECVPFVGGKWELGIDRTLTGQPIRLGGKAYAKGLVMHSRSHVIYVLGGRYRQFAAYAGIVDEMAPRGDVTMVVAGNGRELWQAEDVRGGQAPREVLVDVTGVDVLELVVDYGEDLDLSDHACWAFARLIR